jgi:hypothetical protein
MGKGEVYTGFWWGNVRETSLGRPRHRWEDNIRMNLWDVGVLTGLGCLRIGTGGRHL